MEQGKIKAISDYLQVHFPSAEHANKNDFERIGHKFRIVTKEHVMLCLVSREFIDDNDSETIIKKLEKWHLIDQLRNNPSAFVIVTNHGIRFEAKHWDKIKKSLENSRYKWRTTRGVAKETGLPIEEVAKSFNWHSDDVIKSSIPSDTGEALYTTREHYRKFQSFYAKIISSVSTSVRSSPNSSGEDK